MKVPKVVYVKTGPESTLLLQAAQPHPAYQHLFAHDQNDRTVQRAGAYEVTASGRTPVQENPVCTVPVMTGSPTPAQPPQHPHTRHPAPPVGMCLPVRKSFILIQICLLAPFPH